jgi:hypothetical protein
MSNEQKEENENVEWSVSASITITAKVIGETLVVVDKGPIVVKSERKEFK